MNWLAPSAAIVVAALAQGCAVSPGSQSAAVAVQADATALSSAVHSQTNSESPIALCPAPEGCSAPDSSPAYGADLGPEKNAPVVEGRPITSVVVTQCSLVVAVYMTMPDGRLLRFDKQANIPADQLVAMAYTATRSERVEVSCRGNGVAGYETHEQSV